MKFSRVVFIAAGVWGVLVLTPLYFIFDTIGRQDPPPITHPGFYYGFVGAALAWQLAFFVIASDPVGFRPVMIAAILEKLTYAASVGLLYIQARIRAGDLGFAAADLVFAILFAVSFAKAKTVPAA